jgi:phage gp16-like protein
MTAPAKSAQRKGMMIKVHCARRDLGMDDATYRTILANLFGVESSKDLNLHQLATLNRHFESLGWEPKARASAKGKDAHGRPNLPKTDHRWPLLSKVEALLAEMGAESGKFVPWSYAAAILDRMHGVKRLEWANTGQIADVISALVNGGGRRKGTGKPRLHPGE